MERVKDGFVPLDHRELRFSFRPARDITHPDLAVSGAQIPRGDRQLFEVAKRLESPNRRVWFFCTFPCDSSTSKAGKNVVKVDLIVSTPHGAMLLKVLDWSGACNTNPGEKWFETKRDGTKAEHANQLTELDTMTQWARIYLEKQGCCPPVMTSYVVFSSPHAKPNFTSDPRIVVGPAAASELLLGSGLSRELDDPNGLLQRGQILMKGALEKVRGPPKESGNNSNAGMEQWRNFQVCMDSRPQFDFVFLRKTQCFIFGKFDKFEDAQLAAGHSAIATRFFNRQSGLRYRFQHATEGILSMPVALVTGGLGVEPSCRVTRADYEVKGVKDLAIDLPPSSKFTFRPFGCDGLVSAEVNDVDYLEFAQVPISLTTAEDGTDAGLVDQLGQFFSGVVSKSLQSGVKNMLPFPLNAMVNIATSNSQ